MADLMAGKEFCKKPQAAVMQRFLEAGIDGIFDDVQILRGNRRVVVECNEQADPVPDKSTIFRRVRQLQRIKAGGIWRTMV